MIVNGIDKSNSVKIDSMLVFESFLLYLCEHDVVAKQKEFVRSFGIVFVVINFVNNDFSDKESSRLDQFESLWIVSLKIAILNILRGHRLVYEFHLISSHFQRSSFFDSHSLRLVQFYRELPKSFDIQDVIREFAVAIPSKAKDICKF